MSLNPESNRSQEGWDDDAIQNYCRIGRQEGGSGWGTHVNPWLIHVNGWQKPLKNNKVK